MASLSFHSDEEIDVDAVETSKGSTYELLPNGEYTLQLISYQVKRTLDGTGEKIDAVIEVVSGPLESRKIFETYNTRNKNSQAVTISIGNIKALCLSCGVDFKEACTEFDLVLYKPFNAYVVAKQEIDKATKAPKINPTTGEPYPARNKISKYIPHGNAGSGMAAPVAVKPAFIPAGVAGAVAKGVAGAVAKPSSGLPWGKQDGVPF
jgi:Protein of unknown function (DUF669)